MPESIPLPASAQTFFLNVFKQATLHPDISTLKPVYCLLSGACTQVLNNLPVEARQDFDRELCRILSSNGAGQNSMLLLWCFGIVLLAEHLGQEGENTELQWRTSSGQKLFGTPKGSYKTITLTCMSVVWAIKGQVGVSDDEAVQGIRIACKALRSVESHIRSSWLHSSPLAQNTFQKLTEKIHRVELNDAILLEALCFYILIASPDQAPREATARYERCVMGISRFPDTDNLTESLEVSLSAFAVSLLSPLMD